MTTTQKNETSKTAKPTTKTNGNPGVDAVQDEAQSLDGYTPIARDFEAVAWWRPSEGAIVEGIVRDTQLRPDDEGQMRVIYLIELVKETAAKPIGEDDIEPFPPGSIILVSETAGLIPLRGWAERFTDFQVKIVCKRKAKLKGGRRTMWVFEFGAKGGSPRKIPLDLKALEKTTSTSDESVDSYF